MKPFLAHVKEWRIDTHRTKTDRRGMPQVKWVKVVLQVPTHSRKLAYSIGARLGKHMQRSQPRYVTVGEDLADVVSERDAAHEYLRRWQDWSTKLHRALGIIDARTLPDDTKGRAILKKLVLENGKGCRMGIYCREHGHVHGGEAEHLRSKITEAAGHAVDGQVSSFSLHRLLDEVDARDSLAFLEIQKRQEEDDES